MQARDPGSPGPAGPVRDRGALDFRFAAGAGVVAASLLIGGPNPAQAVADRHGSGSHSNNDHRANGSSGLGDTAKGIASNLVKDVLRIGGSGVGDNSPKPDLDPPLMDLGTGGGDLEDLAVVNSFALQDQTAVRPAAVAESQEGDNISVAAPRSGSGHSGQPATSFQTPRVVVGNGRTPGTHVPSPDSAPEAVLVRDTLVSPAAVAPPRCACGDRDQLSAAAAAADAADRAHSAGRIGGRGVRHVDD